MILSIVVAIFWLTLFVLWIWKGSFFKVQGFKKSLFLAAFGLKLIMAISFYIIYNYYPKYNRQSDSGTFYTASKQLKEMVLKQSDLDLDQIPYWNLPYTYVTPNDTRQTVIYFAVLQLFTLNSKIATVLLVNILAFLGLFVLFKTFLILKLKPVPAFLGCFCVPSTLFWSSGLLKEVWLIFFLGFTLWNFVLFLEKHRLKNLTGFMIFALFLLTIKIYIGMILIPLLIVFGITEKFKIKPAVGYGTLLLVGFLGLFLIGHLNPEYNLLQVLTQKRNAFIRMVEAQEHYDILLSSTSGSFMGFFKQTPLIFFNLLFKPFIFNTDKFLIFLAGFENFCFVVGIIGMLCFYKMPQNFKSAPWLFWIFILSVFVIIGYTTPNMGALMRYKSPMLPFLTVLIASYWDISRFKIFLSRLPSVSRFFKF